MGEPKPHRSEHRRTGGRVTMAMVGRMAGVSQVTVSRALSDPSKVSAKTMQRIDDAIAQTGFVPNAIAGALASHRSLLITVLVPSLTNIVYSSFVKTFGDRMRDAGYQILLSETDFDPAREEALIETHLSRRPDAIMLTGIHHSARARRMLLGADIPVVEVWDMTDNPIDMCVGFSHLEAGHAVAEFVLEQGFSVAGTVTANDQRAHRRCAAFVKRFSARGGKHIAHDCSGAASIAAGREALTDLVDRKAFTTGVIFCSSDSLAQGVMIEAQKRNIAIPNDIAVIGFGDQAFAAHLEPALTTVKVDRDSLGQQAAEAILCRLQGATPTDNVVDIGFQIIRRQSA